MTLKEFINWYQKLPDETYSSVLGHGCFWIFKEIDYPKETILYDIIKEKYS